MKAIFDTRPESGYDDDITSRYHFPNRYLAAASLALNDWIIYREPRREGGREGYVAVARVKRIEPDPSRPGFSYAFIADFLSFDTVVTLRRGTGFYEDILEQVDNPKRIGVALQGKSIRTISDAEFGAITRAGLRETLDPSNAIQLELDPGHLDAASLAMITAPPEDQERQIVQLLVNKKVRAANFRRAVCEAYDNRCAVTGLRIVNGGGKAEVQAAHILPVAEGGPDIVRNGIALSATVHWLFDRHLISLTDDYGLLVSHNKVPAELRSLFTRQLDRINLPANRKLWPYPAYVQRHREQFANS
jgi:putative restriction endonuclease